MVNQEIRSIRGGSAAPNADLDRLRETVQFNTYFEGKNKRDTAQALLTQQSPRLEGQIASIKAQMAENAGNPNFDHLGAQRAIDGLQGELTGLQANAEIAEKSLNKLVEDVLGALPADTVNQISAALGFSKPEAPKINPHHLTPRHKQEIVSAAMSKIQNNPNNPQAAA